MHDDPTRIMGQPGDPEHRPHGNVRLLVAGLIAVIVGLVVAIAVIASDGDSGETTPSVPTTTTEPMTDETTTEPTTTDSTETETETTEPMTDETTTETTAPPPGTPGEEETGSGGIPAE